MLGDTRHVEGRRGLLDALFERDGQSLAELGAVLPAMTRFGVAKHLRVLEDAGLVTTMRSGRSKLHYLNPVPIRLIHDRWISKYAEPWVASMSRLKSDLEHPDEEGPSVDGSCARGPRAAQLHDEGREPSPRSA